MPQSQEPHEQRSAPDTPAPAHPPDQQHGGLSRYLQIYSCAHCCPCTHWMGNPLITQRRSKGSSSSTAPLWTLHYKNLHSTQHLHHGKHSDDLKATTFLQLISGEVALVGLAVPTVTSVSALQSRRRSISSLAMLLVCSPRRIFMQRLHSCRARKAITAAPAPARSPRCRGSSGLSVQDGQRALLAAWKGGTAPRIHSRTALRSKFTAISPDLGALKLQLEKAIPTSDSSELFCSSSALGRACTDPVQLQRL